MDRLKRIAVIALVSMVAGAGNLWSAPVLAQDLGNVAPAAPAAPAAPGAYVPLEMDAMQQLVAPIALYPDAILAQMLVACTYPDNVTAAAQWLAAGNNPAGIDAQNWDLSVKGVARFPAILNYLANNPDLMNQLGDTFINQQADLWSAIQILRAQAMTAGNLASCPQQQVICDAAIVQIVPANPDLIYLPVYDCNNIYVRHTYLPGQPFDPLIHFGPGIEVGVWLHHDIDWQDHCIYVGSWGSTRPWWHDAGGHNYLRTRPGLIAGGRWIRDAHRALPRRISRISGIRANRGYATRGFTRATIRGAVPHGYGHGAAVARSSIRGRISRSSARHR